MERAGLGEEGLFDSFLFCRVLAPSSRIHRDYAALKAQDSATTYPPDSTNSLTAAAHIYDSQFSKTFPAIFQELIDRVLPRSSI